MDSFKWLAVLMAVAFSADIVAGLECYECVNVKVSTSGGLAQDIMGDNVQSEPDCEAASITAMGSLTSKTCAPGEKCAAVRGSVTFGSDSGLLGGLGSVTHSTVARSCMPATSSGCVSGTGEAAQLLSIFLEGASLDGEVCFCDSDLCSAGSCPDSYVKISDYCIEWWMLLIMCAGLVLVLLVFTCCCCCCCRCCRSKGSHGRTIILQTSSSQPRQFENVMYGDTVPIVSEQPDPNVHVQYSP